jgi:OmpA-OmpF porin, OOP family
MKNVGALALVLLLGASGLGCAHDPPAALLTARAAYQQAALDPEIREQAAVPLHEAKQALDRADSAFERDAETDEVEHLSYLAERRVEIARELARRSAAEAEAERLGEARSEVLVDARTREAGLARQQAAQAQQQALLAEQEKKELAAELEELRAKETERGLVLTLGDVFFDVDRAELAPGALHHLTRLADFLRANPERSIVIEGHTDSTGSAGYNLDLSQRRAESVASFLARQGIEADRIATRGYGLAHPIASNATVAGRQQNRRVEIVILEPGQPASTSMR